MKHYNNQLKLLKNIKEILQIEREAWMNINGQERGALGRPWRSEDAFHSAPVNLTLLYKLAFFLFFFFFFFYGRKHVHQTVKGFIYQVLTRRSPRTTQVVVRLTIAGIKF